MTMAEREFLALNVSVPSNRDSLKESEPRLKRIQWQLERTVLAKWIWRSHTAGTFWCVQLNLTTNGEIMKRYQLIKFLFVSPVLAVLLGLASAAFGDVPSMDVTVFDSAGRIAFKGPISGKATFATRNLDAGDYVVQFNTRSPAVKNNHYLLVVSAGKKKVIAAAVAGETFTNGGAAMNIRVVYGSNITGQVAKEQNTAGGPGAKYRVIEGKRFVWVTARTGSNRAAHWEEETLAPAAQVVVWTRDELQKRMDRGGEGSMIVGAYGHSDNLHTGY